LVTQGLAGGHEAARQLRSAVIDHISQRDSEVPPDTKIMIHIFTNMAGTSNIYQESNIIPNSMGFRNFVQGFNKEHPLCNIIDAGNDKEAADSKIKGALGCRIRWSPQVLIYFLDEMRLFHSNLHCKHIIFAGSGDNSYAGFLRQYISANPTSSKVTLIESVPFAHQIREVAAKFETVKFRDIFRETKIEKAEPVRLPIREAPANQPDKVSAPTYASSLRQSSTSEPMAATHNPPNGHAAAMNKSTSSREIFINQYGERVDHPLKIHASFTVIGELKPKKLCNRFFLSTCPYDAESCNQTHKHKKLTVEETEALRFLARSIPCRDSYCRDPDCVMGHRCKFGPTCDAWGKSCRFSDEM
jgi:hypothetical protein